MKKLLLIPALAIVLVSSAFGQSGNRDANNNIVRGPYLTNRFFDNWFIQFGGGASVYIGGQNGNGFDKRIRPTFDLGFGKWFTPTIGVRLQANYTPGVREYSAAHTSPFALWGKASNGFALQKFDLINVHADFLWNLSAAIGGYRADRVYELIPYAGFGWGQVWNSATNVSQNEITTNFGLINKFRVSPTVDINLEIRSAVVNGRFDMSTIDNKVDAPMAVVAGLTFRLGQVKGFDRAADIIVPEYLVLESQIQQLQADNTNLKNKVQMLGGELQKAMNQKPQVKEREVVKTDVVPTMVTVFFKIGTATINKKDLVNLDQYAWAIKEALKVDPQRVFTLTGSADTSTGSMKRNEQLCQLRAKAVHDLLVNKYGIPASNLRTASDLNFNERFGEPYLSRSVTIK